MDSGIAETPTPNAGAQVSSAELAVKASGAFHQVHVASRSGGRCCSCWKASACLEIYPDELDGGGMKLCSMKVKHLDQELYDCTESCKGAAAKLPQQHCCTIDCYHTADNVTKDIVCEGCD